MHYIEFKLKVLISCVTNVIVIDDLDLKLDPQSSKLNWRIKNQKSRIEKQGLRTENQRTRESKLNLRSSMICSQV